jgi:CspA family cold shock protein
MQGVVKSYEPTSGDGIVVGDVPDNGTFVEYDLAADALDGSIFRMLRQGQRVVFDVNQDGRATHLRMGSEVDMGTPGHHA